MNNQELIKQKIEQINQIEIKHQQRRKGYRAQFRKLLLEIEYLGGWMALGYKSKYQFYKKEFGATPNNIDCISRQDGAKDYEILLQVPLGSYDYRDLVGIKDQFTFNNRYSIHFCCLDKSDEIRSRWKSILIRHFNYHWRLSFGGGIGSLLLIWANLTTVTHLPNGEEIHKFSKTKNKRIKPGKDFYKNKSLGSQVKIAQLEKELEEVRGELERERAQDISFLARMQLAALREERDRLKEENETLKAKLNQQLIMNN